MSDFAPDINVTMKLSTALSLVLSLATDNALDPSDCDEENISEAKRQSKALEMVQAHLDSKPLWGLTAKELDSLEMKLFLSPLPEEYVCTVMVRRNLADDLDAIGKDGAKPTQAIGQALVKQLATELQIGWDEGGIGGHFQIVRVDLGKN